MSADPLSECPECKGSLKRLIGGGMGMIFKGSGFYATDYKGAGSSKKDSSGACASCPKNDSCPAGGKSE